MITIILIGIPYRGISHVPFEEFLFMAKMDPWKDVEYMAII
jgi:hypothetical protein